MLQGLSVTDCFWTLVKHKTKPANTNNKQYMQLREKASTSMRLKIT